MTAARTSAFVAGAACASIAPRPEDLREGVWLAGFGSYRQRRATDVRDDPCCRALAVSDGETAFVLAALDLVGASGPLTAAIRTEASRATGLEPERILVACTHSHASPDTQGLWGGVPDAYEKQIVRRSVAAIAEAWIGTQPAHASAGTTTLGGVVRNRRGWPDTDETLTALRLAASDGSTIATLVNYACHPTAIGRDDTSVSRDWCGYTVDTVEREVGGVAVYANGAIGDVVPIAESGVPAARSLGEAVAASTIEALGRATSVEARVDIDMRVLEIPWAHERLSQRVQDAVARGGFALAALTKVGGMRAASVALHKAGRGDLAQIVAALGGMSERGIVRRDGRTFLPAYCGRIAIGDVETLAAPGEVLTRLAAPLRGAMSGRHRMFFGLTHETLGYFVPEDEWMTGRNENYEESVSLGRAAGAALSGMLLATMSQSKERV